MPAEFHFQICLGGGREKIGHSRQDVAIRLTPTLLSVQFNHLISEVVPQKH